MLSLRFHRDHAFTRARMSDYVDGDLDAASSGRIDHHVGLCPHCRRMLESLMRTVRELGKLERPAEPGLADGVIERLRQEPR